MAFDPPMSTWSGSLVKLAQCTLPTGTAAAGLGSDSGSFASAQTIPDERRLTSNANATRRVRPTLCARR